MKGSVSAIVLAAGYSSRMGKFKPLLPLGNKTIIERVVDLFLESGINDIRVVVGYRGGELLPLLKKMGVSCITNEDFEQGMFSSVKAGVKSLDQDLRAFFLLPADIPFSISANIFLRSASRSATSSSNLSEGVCPALLRFSDIVLVHIPTETPHSSRSSLFTRNKSLSDWLFLIPRYLIYFAPITLSGLPSFIGINLKSLRSVNISKSSMVR